MGRGETIGDQRSGDQTKYLAPIVPPLQIRPTPFAPDDALDSLRAEAGLFRLAHDVAKLVAQPAGELAVFVDGAARRVFAVARAVVGVVTLIVIVAVAAACARVGMAVFAAPGRLLFRATGVAIPARTLAVFVAVAAACAVGLVATHAADRAPAAAPLMNNNRYFGQSTSPVWWPAHRPA